MQVRKMIFHSDKSYVECVIGATVHVKITEVGSRKENTGFIVATIFEKRNNCVFIDFEQEVAYSSSLMIGHSLVWKEKIVTVDEVPLV